MCTQVESENGWIRTDTPATNLRQDSIAPTTESHQAVPTFQEPSADSRLSILKTDMLMRASIADVANTTSTSPI